MSGIYRDVYLFATPKTYIADHYITADVTPGATSTTVGDICPEFFSYDDTELTRCTLTRMQPFVLTNPEWRQE